MVEHVLEDDHAALGGRQLDEARHRHADRFLAHQGLQRIGRLGIGRVLGGLDRLGGAHGSAAQQVEGLVVGDAEQPGAQGRGGLQRIEGGEALGDGVLHHVLAVDHRAGQAGAVAVKVGAQFGDEGEERAWSTPPTDWFPGSRRRLLFQDGDPRVAPHAEGRGAIILRVGEDPGHMLAIGPGVMDGKPARIASGGTPRARP